MAGYGEGAVVTTTSPGSVSGGWRPAGREVRPLLTGDASPWLPQEVARHVARDLLPGACVNLGIGLPTLVAEYISADTAVVVHCENGMLGLGPPPAPGYEDPELIDAGKALVTVVPGAAFFSHAEAFAMIRGGHIDVSVMGAFQVSVNGDLANWSVPGEMLPAVGGAMDLAVGARRVVVMMRHTTRGGRARLVGACTYPLTAVGVVRRVYTDLATLDVGDGRFVVLEAAPGLTPPALAALTEAPVVWDVPVDQVPDPRMPIVTENP